MFRVFEWKHEKKKSEMHKKRHAILNTLLIPLFLFHAVSWPVIWILRAFLNKLLHCRDYESNASQPRLRVASIFRQSSKSVWSKRAGKYLITKSEIALDFPLPFNPRSWIPRGIFTATTFGHPLLASYPYFGLVFIERMQIS